MEPDQINIRWAGQGDKHSIAKLLRGLLLYTAGLCDKPESQLKCLQMVLADLDRTFCEPDNIRFVVAENGGEVVGICAVETSYSTWHAKPYIVLNDVFVDMQFRRMRVGTALLQFVTDYAHAIGCCRLDLFVEEANYSAQRLYEDFGFARLKQASYSMPIKPSEGLP